MNPSIAKYADTPEGRALEEKLKRELQIEALKGAISNSLIDVQQKIAELKMSAEETIAKINRITESHAAHSHPHSYSHLDESSHSKIPSQYSRSEKHSLAEIPPPKEENFDDSHTEIHKQASTETSEIDANKEASAFNEHFNNKVDPKRIAEAAKQAQHEVVKQPQHEVIHDYDHNKHSEHDIKTHPKNDTKAHSEHNTKAHSEHDTKVHPEHDAKAHSETSFTENIAHKISTVTETVVEKFIHAKDVATHTISSAKDIATHTISSATDSIFTTAKDTIAHAKDAAIDSLTTVAEVIKEVVIPSPDILGEEEEEEDNVNANDNMVNKENPNEFNRIGDAINYIVGNSTAIDHDLRIKLAHILGQELSETGQEVAQE